jgi:hypothetical protein
MDEYVSLPDFNSQLDFATSLINLHKLEWSQFVLDTILEQDEHNVNFRIDIHLVMSFLIG